VSFTYKKHKGREYLYFQAGREGTYYLSPRNSTEGSNIYNVEKSLKYMQTRLKKDREIIEKLISFLPKDKRHEYATMLK
jgi:hypothetical protein